MLIGSTSVFEFLGTAWSGVLRPQRVRDRVRRVQLRVRVLLLQPAVVRVPEFFGYGVIGIEGKIGIEAKVEFAVRLRRADRSPSSSI
jgi:hypothetical protein